MKNRLLLLICWLPGLLQAQNLENLDEFGKRKFIDLKGSLSLTANIYQTTAEQDLQNPFSYVISGAPVLLVYGVPLPFSFTFANQDFGFSGPDTDQFQRLGISPYYKWVQVHAGYRNIAFSPYTLNNHNFLGGGVELTPGKFRFGFVYGRFLQANPEDTLNSNGVPVSYRRRGYALKVGYGTPDNFIDISILKAKDDPGSIPDPVNSTVTPAENLAIGIDTRQKLFRNIIWELHLAASAYSDDIRQNRLETGDGNLPGWISTFITPRISTRLNFAGHTSLTYQTQAFSLRSEYRRVDPEYQTMGAYFFNNDLERLTLAPSVRLFKGKLNLTGSVGLQRDNLLDNKKATTERTISSANVQYTPIPQLTLNFQYGNYATEQSAGLINLNDSIRVYQVNHNLAFTPSYYIATDNFMHNFVLNLSSQILNDRNLVTEQFTQSETNSAIFNYKIRSRQYNYGLSLGSNFLSLINAGQNITRYGVSAGAEKSLFDQKLRITTNWVYNLSRLAETSDGHILTGTGNISYQLSQNHLFNFRARMLFNRTSLRQFDDYLYSLNYNLSF
mgnify:CR=1 FL=1